MPLVAWIEGGDLSKVWEVKTIGRSRDADARTLLEQIAKQVQPIMRKRKWRVLLLSEFYPKNSALLGLNIGAGKEVRIRLRKPGREAEFLPYESLVGTMLHELVHNDHGPHDAKFYKLLDEITKECEELMAKGISGTGEGFDARGTRLGGRVHNPPSYNMRNALLGAAEKRAHTGSLMSNGPRRLGGDNAIMKALSPIQAAAMAAERRLRDDLWCGAPDTLGADGQQKAEERECAKCHGNPSITSKISLSSSASSSNQDHSVASTSNFSSWECTVCTLLNPPLARICAACSTVRAWVDAQSWTCKSCTLENAESLHQCAACDEPKLNGCSGKRKLGQAVAENVSNMELNAKKVSAVAPSWSCKFCTLQNGIAVDKCAACNEWRYSYGPPVSTIAPYGRS